MQRFYESHPTTNDAPLYDDEAVRRVLTRATEIEAETETKRLTARQVETLGRDLGISPDAVRRALGESNGANTEVALPFQTQRLQGHRQLTQTVLKSAYLPNVWFALLQMPLSFIQSRSVDTGAMSGETIVAYVLYVYLPVLFCLAVRSGFVVKRVGTGITGAWLATLTALALSCISGYIGAITPPSLESMLVTNIAFSLLGVLGGALGVGTRYLWDRVPRDSVATEESSTDDR